MFGRPIRLFKLLGFEVRVDASWLIIAALVTWSLGAGFFPYYYPGLASSDYWWMGVAGAAGLFGSIIVHELFHSLVARRFNLQIRGITLFIFGGVAEMEKEPPSAKAEFSMAIAGPITSIVIGFIFYGIHEAAAGAWPRPVAGVLAYLAWINWLLAAFNLIPAFPLDGGRVLRSMLWYRKGDLGRATRISSSIGSGFGGVLMILAVVQLFTGNFISAVWWFLIGMFLRGASQASYQQLMIRSILAGEPVRRFMRTNPVTVSPDATIQELVEDYVYKHHYKMFPVVDGEQELVGCVTTSQIKSIPRQQWPWHRVHEIVQPCSAGNTVSPDTDAMNVLATMTKTGSSRLMVVENNHLEAVITLKDLLNFLSTKLELEGYPQKDLPRVA